mmetsp:Transcript_15074/g.32932  ORF Transcript_15074/g.32932 Transcript_15074/m.32932 type:complete len:1072 (+) Transcript_15074:274-3489(+)|eukprot:CAMPEP_0168764500 /NCGR_PEP_ID=MMETSP0724-20121128/24904_1 /TAXON_ID=265536 /ORGANISM="Amphiprora sp., Strain CCMP467" /LENGTH=1071 /DNA_ID=CAMNT_0008813723 /DNA_START=258 /DNA_END=3473 /DNA_ORIENTATION=+
MVARNDGQSRDGSGESTTNDEKRPLILFLPPETKDSSKLGGRSQSSDDSGDEEDGNPSQEAAFQHYQAMVMQHPHAPLLLLQQQERLHLLQQAQQQKQLRRCILTVCTALLVVAILCWPWVFLSANGHERHGGSVFSSSRPRPRWSIFPNRGSRRYSSPNKDSIAPGATTHKNGTFLDEKAQAAKPQQSQYTTTTRLEDKKVSVTNHKDDMVHNNPRVSSANHPHFPSFLEFEKGTPIDVQYNAQAILLNGQPSLLLGGSLHPTRVGSKVSWERALDEAVHNGLNLITIYVFWSAHQPFERSTLDWTLPYNRDIVASKSLDKGRWTLADAVNSCANRGLFVHIRLGPYVCAEYSLGGIPEWIPALHPNIRMRRMDPIWLQLMEVYVKNATTYLTQERLWAHQGGPIILAQIENELGEEETGFMVETRAEDDEEGRIAMGGNVGRQSLHISEIQQYANWCGDLVQRVAPRQVVWNMCNGLTANNTVLTYNGDWTSLSWLQEQHDRPGGRIQVDQPAMWTEDEQGFQLWGETPDRPVDYFWGMTARDVSKNAMRWIARQGLHFNYYMWFGSYNRHRMAAAGIMNAYATDAVLCPSGERREPKFGHLTKMHQTLASIAPLLTNPQNVVPVKPKATEIKKDGTWSLADINEIASFTYRKQRRSETIGSYSSTPVEAIFVENNSNDTAVARVPSILSDGDDIIVVTLKPYSVALLVDGIISFGSATLGPDIVSFRRKTLRSFVPLLDWNSWKEDPSGVSCDNGVGIRSLQPIEQTTLHQGNVLKERFWSDYSWYITSFLLTKPIAMDNRASLRIDTDKSVAMLVYIDGVFQGSAENHEHKEGAITLEIPLTKPLGVGSHKLAIMAENFGYHNLIGRWGGRVGLKPKGIVGNVTLVTQSDRFLLTNREDTFWCSVAGSQGEQLGLPSAAASWKNYSRAEDGPVWSWAFFDTPMFDSSDQRLFLDVTSGRGHVWLNGHDLGRYWSIRRTDLSGDGRDAVDPREDDASNDETQYSQKYYHLPEELLATEGNLNELLLFNTQGQNGKHGEHSVQIVLSWIDPSTSHSFDDSIGFAESCLV